MLYANESPTSQALLQVENAVETGIESAYAYLGSLNTRIHRSGPRMAFPKEPELRSIAFLDADVRSRLTAPPSPNAPSTARSLRSTATGGGSSQRSTSGRATRLDSSARSLHSARFPSRTRPSSAKATLTSTLGSRQRTMLGSSSQKPRSAVRPRMSGSNQRLRVVATEAGVPLAEHNALSALSSFSTGTDLSTEDESTPRSASPSPYSASGSAGASAVVSQENGKDGNTRVPSLPIQSLLSALKVEPVHFPPPESFSDLESSSYSSISSTSPMGKSPPLTFQDQSPTFRRRRRAGRRGSSPLRHHMDEEAVGSRRSGEAPSSALGKRKKMQAVDDKRVEAAKKAEEAKNRSGVQPKHSHTQLEDMSVERSDGGGQRDGEGGEGGNSHDNSSPLLPSTPVCLSGQTVSSASPKGREGRRKGMELGARILAVADGDLIPVSEVVSMFHARADAQRPVSRSARGPIRSWMHAPVKRVVPQKKSLASKTPSAASTKTRGRRPARLQRAHSSVTSSKTTLQKNSSPSPPMPSQQQHREGAAKKKMTRGKSKRRARHIVKTGAGADELRGPKARVKRLERLSPSPPSDSSFSSVLVGNPGSSSVSPGGTRRPFWIPNMALEMVSSPPKEIGEIAHVSNLQ